MRPYIGLVGFGYWGKNLARVFMQLNSLHTICDLGEKNLETAKKEYPDIYHTHTFSDILNNDDIKAIVISTPAESHYRLAKDAIFSKKDVFVEKPLALTVEEGNEITELAKKHKRILMVGHLLEYHPAVIKLKELVDKGELGRIHYIYSNRLNLGKIRREENILWSFAPHDISVMLLLLNEMPETVSAHGGNYLHRDIADVTVSNLNFASGVKGHIFVSWLHPYKEQKLIVVGDKQMAVFDDVSEQNKLLLYNHKIDWIDRIPVPKKENAKAIEFDTAEPLLLECRHFLHCINTREIPKTDGHNGIRILKVLEACELSLKKDGSLISFDSVISSYSLPTNNYYVHPTSSIDQPCQIGEGTRIWHYSHIMKGAKLGKNCTIGQNVFIGSRAELGNNVKVQNNVSIYDCAKLEDDVFCGPSCVFTNVINPRSQISRKNDFKETLVKKGATLGANSTIICGITIGEYAFIGAGAVVTKDIPAYALVYGNPARMNGWMCRCGVKLRICDNKAICDNCKKEYIYDDNRIVKNSN